MSPATGHLVRASICAAITVGCGYSLIHNGSGDIRIYIGIVCGAFTAIRFVVLAIRDTESPAEVAERLGHQARSRELLRTAKDRRRPGVHG